jgi:hypothetical protein
MNEAKTRAEHIGPAWCPIDKNEGIVKREEFLVVVQFEIQRA